MIHILHTWAEALLIYVKILTGNEPNLSLWWCAQSVRNAIKQDERLAGIEGMYVLVDEYDAFPNNYLEPPKTAWESTDVGRTVTKFGLCINLR